MDVIGTLVAESLAPTAVIEIGLTLRRLHRITVQDPADGQPAIWTLIDFTCPADDVDPFAEQLAAGLAAGPWYLDMATDTTKYVIFAGKTYAFPRGDAAGNQEAVEYARSVGVPEAQLDWPV